MEGPAAGTIALSRILRNLDFSGFWEVYFDSSDTQDKIKVKIQLYLPSCLCVTKLQDVPSTFHWELHMQYRCFLGTICSTLEEEELTLYLDACICSISSFNQIAILPIFALCEEHAVHVLRAKINIYMYIQINWWFVFCHNATYLGDVLLVLYYILKILFNWLDNK